MATATTDHRLSRVVTGLKLVYASMLLVVLAVVVGIVFAFAFVGNAAAQGGAAPDQNKLAIFVLVLAGIGLLGRLLAIVGKIYCLEVPEKVKATGPIYAAVGLTVVALLIELGQQFFGIGTALGSVGGLLSGVGYLCFLVFLRRLAEFLDDRRQVGRARFLTIGAIALVVIAIPLFVLLIQARAAGPGVAAIPPWVGLAMFAVGIFYLVLFVTYANLVNGLRHRLESYLVGRTLE